MKRLVALAAVALLARAFLFGVAVPSLEGLRHVELSAIASHINAGRGFVFEQYGATYRAWKEPLYIYVLAALTSLAGEADAPILALQWLTGALCAVAAFVVARLILGRSRAAITAGALVAANPFLLYYDTHFVHSLSLDTLLFLCVSSAILWALDRPASEGSRPALLAGLITGIALWQRSTLLAALVGGFAGALFSSPRADRRRRVRDLALASATAVLSLGPWVARNAAVVGRPVVTSDFAHVVWLGNNTHSNGTYGDAAGRRVFEHAEPAFKRRIQSASEMEQYDLFLNDAALFARREPGRFLALLGVRVLGFFWFTPNAGVRYADWQARVYGVAYSSLLALGVLGFVLFWREAPPGRRVAAAALCGAVLGVAAVHALTALNLKHRVPLEMALSVFAAEPLARLLPDRRARASAP